MPHLRAVSVNNWPHFPLAPGPVGVCPGRGGGDVAGPVGAELGSGKVHCNPANGLCVAQNSRDRLDDYK